MGVEVRLPWSNIILTKGCRLIVCRVQNADLIAVSLACPKDPTSPYRMHMGPPRESSVRDLLEKVGNLRHCSSCPIKLGIFDIYRSTLTQSNCLGLSSSILNGILTKKNYIYIFWIHRFCILFLIRRKPSANSSSYFSSSSSFFIIIRPNGFFAYF